MRAHLLHGPRVEERVIDLQHGSGRASASPGQPGSAGRLHPSGPAASPPAGACPTSSTARGQRVVRVHGRAQWPPRRCRDRPAAHRWSVDRRSPWGRRLASRLQRSGQVEVTECRDELCGPGQCREVAQRCSVPSSRNRRRRFLINPATSSHALFNPACCPTPVADGFLEPVIPFHVLPVHGSRCGTSSCRSIGRSRGQLDGSDRYSRALSRPRWIEVCPATLATTPAVEPVLDAEADVPVVVDGDALPELRTRPSIDVVAEVGLAETLTMPRSVFRPRTSTSSTYCPQCSLKASIVVLRASCLLDDAGHDAWWANPGWFRMLYQTAAGCAYDDVKLAAAAGSSRRSPCCRRRD